MDNNPAANQPGVPPVVPPPSQNPTPSVFVPSAPPQQPPSQTSNSSGVYPSIVINKITNPNRLYAIPLLGGIVKLIFTIPQMAEILVLTVISSFLTTINSLVVLFTGKYWQTAYNFNLGFLRFITKNQFYLFGLTDKYPGFNLQINDNYTLDVPYKGSSSRLFAIPLLGAVIRYLLIIPYFIYLYILGMGSSFGVLFASLFVLIKREYPESIFELSRDSVRVNNASVAYLSGMSDTYPSFNISMNHKTIKIILIIIGALLMVFQAIDNFSKDKSDALDVQNAPVIETSY